MPSLIAGMTLAGLYGGASYTINSGNCFYGHALAAGTSVALAVTMGKRGLKSKAIFPGKALAVLGSVSAVYEGMKAWEWKDSI
mmetsp:Transcript_2111/g.4324  ORF Transcript_2111/g.4324 Transcript_2111/m.4324 type:complete len:83 (+) Transcript_2111:96-344(+)